eukprot:CAMPEP_0201734980 /NCGR_PEP_ID=MMETSP0593-20130828/35900_1 /ASSEMBLY_ACC=CAM_ASM_000672 /TAXON_ID=267983 /ORGANISM="Skeletonema japonicum, Strain CCMP2506" /LENGTH=151 /DNA_ID=CAMNT_0048228455 /DNA_START=9 /DNA_END=464 /DNA_ORIENTATION=-
MAIHINNDRNNLPKKSAAVMRKNAGAKPPLTIPTPNGTIKLSGKYGRWTPAEKAAFLTGLRRFGRGKWKEIAKLIPSRSTVQVKTHAQMIMRRVDAGEDVFADLRAYENATMIRPPYPPLSKETIKMYQKLTSVDQGAVQILLMLHKNKFS